MQAEKVVRSPAGVDSELQIVINIFFFVHMAKVYMQVSLLCI